MHRGLGFVNGKADHGKSKRFETAARRSIRLGILRNVSKCLFDQLAPWLSWLKCLPSKQEIMRSNLAIEQTFFLAAWFCLLRNCQNFANFHCSISFLPLTIDHRSSLLTYRKSYLEFSNNVFLLTLKLNIKVKWHSGGESVHGKADHGKPGRLRPPRGGLYV